MLSGQVTALSSSNKDAAYSVRFQAVSAESGDKGWIKKAAVITGRFILKV